MFIFVHADICIYNIQTDTDAMRISFPAACSHQAFSSFSPEPSPQPRLHAGDPRCLVFQALPNAI